MWVVVKETFSEFWADECPRMAAALAFYAVFALPALLTFTVLVAAAVVDREQITTRIAAHLHEAMGPAEAQQLQELLASAQQPGQSLWAGLVGLAVLIASATGMLLELQTALNRAWHVEVDPRRSAFWTVVGKRLISLALLVGVAALLVASLILSWTLARFGQEIELYLPQWLSAHAIATLHAARVAGPGHRPHCRGLQIPAGRAAALVGRVDRRDGDRGAVCGGKDGFGAVFLDVRARQRVWRGGFAGAGAAVDLLFGAGPAAGCGVHAGLARHRGKKVVPEPGMQRTGATSSA